MQEIDAHMAVKSMFINVANLGLEDGLDLVYAD